MRKQCVPGSFFSAHALEPGNEASYNQDSTRAQWGEEGPRATTRFLMYKIYIIGLGKVEDIQTVQDQYKMWENLWKEISTDRPNLGFSGEENCEILATSSSIGWLHVVKMVAVNFAMIKWSSRIRSIGLCRPNSSIRSYKNFKQW